MLRLATLKELSKFDHKELTLPFLVQMTKMKLQLDSREKEWHMAAVCYKMNLILLAS